MMNSWMRMCMDSMMLAVESQQVIALRLAKIAQGGPAADAEMNRMVKEKVFAAGEAAWTTSTGGSAESVIKQYRRKVQANARRLSAGA